MESVASVAFLLFGPIRSESGGKQLSPIPHCTFAAAPWSGPVAGKESNHEDQKDLQESKEVSAGALGARV
jgi:hypothetical protein